ncbi:hypothetical protein L5515_003146 [Caenorhabditis briggsae]|uniref:RRM domain-containing protein n=2 Tax=Caenorhabditis briggsae TaxID=6238 RepID=A0AAE9EGY4_CAEBR|nr:hypothetical protein L5515_003146 [Caenorhabditis briggsae]
MPGDSPPEERTVYVANITPEVTEDMLEELFLQAGPLVKVITRNVRDSTARFALVEFEDEESVIFAIKILHGIRLFDREIQVKPRNNTRQEEAFRRQRSEIDSLHREVEEGRVQSDRRRSGGDGRDRRFGEWNSRDSRDSWDTRDSRSGRDSRDNDRSSRRRSDSSWQQHQSQSQQMHQPRHHQNHSFNGGEDNWRGGSGNHTPQNQQFMSPESSMLPHQHFIHQMRHDLRNSAPASYGNSSSGGGGPSRRHQNHQNHYSNPPYTPRGTQNYQNRHRGGADRNSANHYNRQGGGGRF